MNSETQELLETIDLLIQEANTPDSEIYKALKNRRVHDKMTGDISPTPFTDYLMGLENQKLEMLQIIKSLGKANGELQSALEKLHVSPDYTNMRQARSHLDRFDGDLETIIHKYNLY